MIQAAANFNIHSLADFFLGKTTEVILNKTLINSGLEFETIVSAAVDQGNTDFYHGFVGSVLFFFSSRKHHT